MLFVPRRLALLAVLLPALCGRPAAALSSLRFEVRRETNAAAVLGAGEVLLRVRAPKLDDAAHLAGVIVERLRELAEQGASGDVFRVVEAGDDRSVEADGRRVCLLTAEAAKLAGSTPPRLASQWLENLRRAFAGPYLSVPGSGLQVPQGEEVGVPLRGQPAGVAPTIDEPTDGIVTASLTQGGGLRVFGAALGSTTLVLRRGAARLDVPVAVKKRAGRLRTPIETVVTGSGTDLATLRAATASALFAAVDLEPGATFDYDVPTRIAAPAVGGAAEVPVKVVLDGEGFFEERREVTVTLRGEAWGDQPADRLLVSNKPESVAESQLLLRAPLPTAKRSRLLYHHKTIATSNLLYEVRLLNAGTSPARVHVRDAHAGPNPDEIFVGHLAAKAFWEQNLDGRGAVLRLPPGCAWTLVSEATPPQQVLSGLSEFTPLEGDGVEVQVVATTGRPYRGPSRIDGAPRAPFSDLYTHDNPLRAAAYTYEVGGRWAFINVGRDPISSLTGLSLQGNFGVTYAFEVTFANPTAAESRFELAFSADGGVARGVLVVDGRIMETGLVRPTHQERLLDFTLPPGGRRTYRLRILPQSGSNYPLRLVGRPFQRTWSGRGAGP